MSRELLKRALDYMNEGDWEYSEYMRLMREIEAELAKPEPDPVAWMYDYKDPINPAPTLDHVTALQRKINHVCVLNVRPLYTTPPNQSARIAEQDKKSDAQYRNGFIAGWNAAQVNDESLLKRVELRVNQ